MESPGNYTYLDLSLEQERLVARLEKVNTPAEGAGLSWGGREPPQTRPTETVWAVGRGPTPDTGSEQDAVAFFYSPDPGEKFVKEEGKSIPSHRTDTGEYRYIWTDFSRGTLGLHLMILLPPGHTLVDWRPVPAESWVYSGRLALIWLAGPGDPDYKTFSWGLSLFVGNVQDESDRLNGKFASEREKPGAFIPGNVKFPSAASPMGPVGS